LEAKKKEREKARKLNKKRGIKRHIFRKKKTNKQMLSSIQKIKRSINKEKDIKMGREKENNLYQKQIEL
jgi:hypothetical protein